MGDGNDTVTVTTSTVSSGLACGDIPVATVINATPVVNGTIDGAGGNDSLIFSFATSDLNATLGGAAQAYSSTNFESVRGSATLYRAGPMRWYDDGVVLAFTSKDGNGIDVCSGPNGWRVATIDFSLLDPVLQNFTGKREAQNGMSADA